MAKTKHVLNVSKRDADGSAVARRLRKEGLIPAVVYSKGAPAVTVSVNAAEWLNASKHELNLISLKMDGKETLVLLKEVQNNFIRGEAMHIDFMAVSHDQIITTKVPVRAGSEAPAGVALGGILDQNIHELEISCTPDDLPEHIEVDVSKLNIGEAIHVNMVALPKGVKAVTPAELVVFTVIDPNAQAEEEAAAPAEGEAAAEPEIVGAKEKAEAAAAAEAEKAEKK